MADGDGKRICGICRWYGMKVKNPGDHHLHLALFGAAVSHHGLFDFQRCVFEDWDATYGAGQYCHTTDMPLFYQAFYILSIKNIFDRHGIGRRLFNDSR